MPAESREPWAEVPTGDSRFGCSDIAFVSIVAAIAFGVFYFILSQVFAEPGPIAAQPNPTPARSAAAPTAISRTASPTVTVAPAVTPTPPPKPTPTVSASLKIANTDGQGVRLRATPSTNAEILATLNEGAVVHTEDGETQADGFTWRKVRDDRGRVGWVPDRFLISS